MNAAPCIYLQLEIQKMALFHMMMENFKKDLNQLLQMSMLQKAYAANHSTSSCSDCLLSVIRLPEALSQHFGVTTDTNLASLSSKMDDLKASFEEMLQQANSQFDSKPLQLSLSNSLNDSTCSEGPKHESKETSLQLETFVKQEYTHETEENTDSNTIESVSSPVPKVDSLRNKGFKPKATKKTQKSEIKKSSKASKTRYQEAKSLLKFNEACNSRQQQQKGFSLKDALKKLLDSNSN